MNSRRQSLSTSLIVVAGVLGGILPAYAIDPNGVLLDSGTHPAIVADGAGGAIAAWSLAGGPAVAARVDARGVLQWSAALCATCAPTSSPAITPDGSGGAIVAWGDLDAADILVQHVDATGATVWGTNGVALGIVGNEFIIFQGEHPELVSDGAHGAIIAWPDNRCGPSVSSSCFEIYAQRLNGLGTAQWGAGGVAVVTDGVANVDHPAIASDGAGGAWIAGEAFPQGGGARLAVLLNGVSAGGTRRLTLPLFMNSSSSIASASTRIIPAGSGSAIVTWSSGDIFAQKVSAANALQWPSGGVPLCIAAGTQNSPAIASDSTGGAVVAWQDHRGGVNLDIYAQRVNAAGVPQWTADGVALCTASKDQDTPTIVSDGAAGAIVSWYDFRPDSGSDIYAQRIDAGGVPRWSADGVTICKAASDQQFPAIATDGAGGAFVTWQDFRSGTNWDIYAQRVNPNGLVLAVPPVAGHGPAEARAWPDPFRDRVQLAFVLAASSTVHMEVFDVHGRRVWTSPTALMGSGPHAMAWNGRADNGNQADEGIYFLRMRGPGVEASRAVVRLK